MKPPLLIYGFAIVSADGMIADADRVMPQSLKHEADHLFFEKALAEADLILHGRQSHEGHTESLAASAILAGPARWRSWSPIPLAARKWLWNPAGNHA